MSVTPCRFSSTTSLAFMSRQSCAATCTAPSRAPEEDRDVAMQLRERFRRSAPPAVSSLLMERKFRQGQKVHFTRQRIAGSGCQPRSLLLLDYPDLDLGVDVRVEANRHAVNTKRANRLVELDLPFFNGESLGLELMRDVGRRHRSEQLSLVADTGGEGERDGLETARQLLSRLAALLFRLIETLLFLRDALLVSRCRLISESTGKQIIPGVAGRDLNDVAGVTELFDCLPENDFH